MRRFPSKTEHASGNPAVSLASLRIQPYSRSRPSLLGRIRLHSLPIGRKPFPGPRNQAPLRGLGKLKGVTRAPAFRVHSTAPERLAPVWLVLRHAS